MEGNRQDTRQSINTISQQSSKTNMDVKHKYNQFNPSKITKQISIPSNIPKLIFNISNKPTKNKFVSQLQVGLNFHQVIITIVVGTPGPDLLLPVFIAADPSKRI